MEPSGEGEAGKRQGRERRGWGPFSGGQLTLIVVTLAVLILFPVGAWALTFTNVSIIDPGGVNRAKVNATGQLSTSAAVTGAVTATPNPPGASWNSHDEGSGLFGTVTDGACGNATVAVPALKALVVTSVSVEFSNVTTGPLTVGVGVGTPGSPCSVAAADLENTTTSSSPLLTTFQFPNGLVVKPGHTVDVYPNSTSLDGLAQVQVHGYLVASTLCTATNTWTSPAVASPFGCF